MFPALFNTCFNICSFYFSLWWGMSMFVCLVDLEKHHLLKNVFLFCIAPFFPFFLWIDYHTIASFGQCQIQVLALQYRTIKLNHWEWKTHFKERKMLNTLWYETNSSLTIKQNEQDVKLITLLLFCLKVHSQVCDNFWQLKAL